VQIANLPAGATLNVGFQTLGQVVGKDLGGVKQEGSAVEIDPRIV
jgi:hypothetical protein